MRFGYSRGCLSLKFGLLQRKSINSPLTIWIHLATHHVFESLYLRTAGGKNGVAAKCGGEGVRAKAQVGRGQRSDAEAVELVRGKRHDSVIEDHATNGVPLPPITVAVNVTLVPTGDWLMLEVSAVAVSPN